MSTTRSQQSLDALFAEHDVWLTVERGLAENSLAAYRRDLRRYRDFLAREGATDPEAIGEPTVVAYVEYLERQLRIPVVTVSMGPGREQTLTRLIY